MADNRYKIMTVYDEDQVHSYQLYDLVKDTGETVNVAQEHSNITDNLLSQVEKWRVSVMNSVKKVGCLNSA